MIPAGEITNKQLPVCSDTPSFSLVLSFQNEFQDILETLSKVSQSIVPSYYTNTNEKPILNSNSKWKYLTHMTMCKCTVINISICECVMFTVSLGDFDVFILNVCERDIFTVV